MSQQNKAHRIIHPPEYFGFRQAAEYIKMTYHQFRYHVEQGRIFPLKLGEEFVVFSQAQLDDFRVKGETSITIPAGTLLTHDQGAEAAGESPRNFRRLVEEGQIPVHLIGRRFAVNASDIPALVAKQRQARPGRPVQKQ